MDEWVKSEAGHIAARFERDLAALVAVSSPSGDAIAFEECAAVAAALAPEEASVVRPGLFVAEPCAGPAPAA
jgi:glutamate carboxypeptidase